jgi:hypothetical protein
MDTANIFKLSLRGFLLFKLCREVSFIFAPTQCLVSSDRELMQQRFPAAGKVAQEPFQRRCRRAFGLSDT